MNETRELKAFQTYFSPGAELYYYGSGKGARLFSRLCATCPLHGYEAPDFYITSDDELLLIEHFEFSSYRQNRKGDTFRQEEARIQRKADAMVPTEEVTVIHGVIQGESSYQIYLENAGQAFCAHYSQIDNYVNNLRDDGILKEQDYRIAFFMEDVSPLGTAMGGNSAWDPDTELVTLAKSREFLELFERNDKVDYVLACSSYENHRLTWFIDRKELDAYYKEAVDYQRLQFFAFKPNVITAKVLVKKE